VADWALMARSWRHAWACSRSCSSRSRFAGPARSHLWPARLERRRDPLADGSSHPEGRVATNLWKPTLQRALDAYLLATIIALFGHHGGFRLYEARLRRPLCPVHRSPRARLCGPGRGWSERTPRAWGTPTWR
jgi:hypothetical protein